MEWNGMEWSGMHCTAMECTALHCNATQCTAMQRNRRATMSVRARHTTVPSAAGVRARATWGPGTGSSRWRVIPSGVAPFSTSVTATTTTRVPAPRLLAPPRGADLVVRHDEDAPHPRRVLLDGAQREAELVRVAVPSGEEGQIEARRSAVLRVTPHARGTLTPR